MSQHPDAIIGTGVIGTAIAEMAKNGWKTLSLDRTPVGHGSTAGSCAIIRMHYSTFDGTAFAWEGHYWRDGEEDSAFLTHLPAQFGNAAAW